ncbi:MAG: hypothetical protein QNK60_03285 [Flavobacteriales bacterium]
MRINRDQPKIPHYSTVTKSLSREDFSKRKVNLLFDIDIMETNLNFYPKYNSHQTYLFNKSIELQKSGLGYRKISKWFNENNILSIMEKEFKPNHVCSLLKKGKIRENRIERSFESNLTDLDCTILYSK